jgi:hypothetical protein
LIWPNMEYPFPFLTRLTLFFFMSSSGLKPWRRGDGYLFTDCAVELRHYKFSFLFSSSRCPGWQSRMRIATTVQTEQRRT